MTQRGQIIAGAALLGLSIFLGMTGAALVVVVIIASVAGVLLGLGAS